jgi:hypothetical protein
MTWTRTSRVANYDPIKYWAAIIILCAVLWSLAITIGLDLKTINEQEKQISHLQMDTLYLKDALKLKISIVEKRDSAYAVWERDHELRSAVKELIEKRKLNTK